MQHTRSPSEQAHTLNEKNGFTSRRGPTLPTGCSRSASRHTCVCTGAWRHRGTESGTSAAQQIWAGAWRPSADWGNSGTAGRFRHAAEGHNRRQLVVHAPGPGRAGPTGQTAPAAGRAGLQRAVGTGAAVGNLFWLHLLFKSVRRASRSKLRQTHLPACHASSPNVQQSSAAHPPSLLPPPGCHSSPAPASSSASFCCTSGWRAIS